MVKAVSPPTQGRHALARSRPSAAQPLTIPISPKKCVRGANKVQGVCRRRKGEREATFRKWKLIRSSRPGLDTEGRSEERVVCRVKSMETEARMRSHMHMQFRTSSSRFFELALQRIIPSNLGCHSHRLERQNRETQFHITCPGSRILKGRMACEKSLDRNICVINARGKHAAPCLTNLFAPTEAPPREVPPPAPRRRRSSSIRSNECSKTLDIG